jgi:hypothetical protein
MILSSGQAMMIRKPLDPAVACAFIKPPSALPYREGR